MLKKVVMWSVVLLMNGAMTQKGFGNLPQEDVTCLQAALRDGDLGKYQEVFSRCSKANRSEMVNIVKQNLTQENVRIGLDLQSHLSSAISEQLGGKKYVKWEKKLLTYALTDSANPVPADFKNVLEKLQRLITKQVVHISIQQSAREALNLFYINEKALNTAQHDAVWDSIAANAGGHIPAAIAAIAAPAPAAGVVGNPADVFAIVSAAVSAGSAAREAARLGADSVPCTGDEGWILDADGTYRHPAIGAGLAVDKAWLSVGSLMKADPQFLQAMEALVGIADKNGYIGKLLVGALSKAWEDRRFFAPDLLNQFMECATLSANGKLASSKTEAPGNAGTSAPGGTLPALNQRASKSAAQKKIIESVDDLSLEHKNAWNNIFKS